LKLAKPTKLKPSTRLVSRDVNPSFHQKQTQVSLNWRTWITQTFSNPENLSYSRPAYANFQPASGHLCNLQQKLQPSVEATAFKCINIGLYIVSSSVTIVCPLSVSTLTLKHSKFTYPHCLLS